MGILRSFKLITLITLFMITFMIVFGIVVMNKTKENTSQGYEVDEQSIQYIKNEGYVIEGEAIVKMYDEEKNEVVQIPLEEYVEGVIAGEMPATFEEEALKAQAVAARTYYIAKRISPCNKAKEHGAEICNTTHCQVYKSKEKKLEEWGNEKGETYWNKIVQAVEETKGKVITYDNKIIEYPQFFAISSGKTENAVDVFAVDVPYLKSIDSPGEEIANKYESTVEINSSDFISKVNTSYPKANLNYDNLKLINIVSRTQGDGVKEISLGNISISGVEFRKLMGINSTDFNIGFVHNKVKIACKGYGHRVGMSQWGARVMAKEGKNYEEILKHYYTGINIDEVKFKFVEEKSLT